MLGAVLLPFVAAVLTPWLYRRSPLAGRVMAVAVPLVLFGWLLTFAGRIRADEAVRSVQRWVPAANVELSFRLDGLAYLLAVLVAGIGVLVLLYAGRYLGDHPRIGQLQGGLLAFMGSMLGLVLADNVLLLYVFWELTGVSSFLLIGFDSEREEARSAAVKALLVSAAGGLALLAGVLLLGSVAGSFEISTVIDRGAVVRAHPTYPAILALLLIAAFTKSAQLPFHFWLPAAMEAPTPVSAYLHSATMVKAGVYLLLRLGPVLDGGAAWLWSVSLIGAATALWGSIQAIRQTDLKRILAYSTVAALGQLVLLIGLGEPEAIEAAVVFLLAHSLYKGALFLVAGAVDHEIGTRDVREFGGLMRDMPVTGAAGVLAGLSMAGLPPLLGFISKEVGYSAKLGFDIGGTAAFVAVGILVNALTFAAALIVVFGTFFGRHDTPRDAHEAPVVMLTGPVLLAGAGLLFGLLPSWIGSFLVEPAAEAAAEQPLDITLHILPGLHAELLLSVVTVALGGLLYTVRARVRTVLGRLDVLSRYGPAAWYDGVIAAALWLGRTQMRIGDRRPLAISFTATFLLLGGATVFALLQGGPPPRWPGAGGPVHEWVLAGLVAAAAITAVATRSRLLGITSLGTVGFGVALLFSAFGAPDLAITQFLVETLTLVIASLVLVHLPPLGRERGGRAGHALDIGVAVIAGAAVGLLVLSAAGVAAPDDVSRFYARESVPGGHGRNIVNVILVDFRAFDTLGETVVIAGAAAGAFVLLSAKRGRGGAKPIDSLILETALRPLLTILLLLGAFLLVRGHDEPGGGFIGGLIVALAVALAGIAQGPAAARRLIRAHPLVLVAAGLVIAIASGVVSMLLGAPPFTGQWAALQVGGATLDIGTPLLFDIGVSLLVIGAVTMMIVSLEEI